MKFYFSKMRTENISQINYFMKFIDKVKPLQFIDSSYSKLHDLEVLLLEVLHYQQMPYEIK